MYIFKKNNFNYLAELAVSNMRWAKSFKFIKFFFTLMVWKKYTAKQIAAWKKKKGFTKKKGGKTKFKTPWKATKKKARRVRDDVAYGKRLDGQRAVAAAQAAVKFMSKKNL